MKSRLLSGLGFEYSYTDLDSGLVIAKMGLNLARKQIYKRGIVNALNIIGTIYQDKADYKTALECYTEARTIAEELNDQQALSVIYANEGNTHITLKDFINGRHYLFEALKLSKELKYNFYNDYLHIGNMYLDFMKVDSALYYFDLSLTQPKINIELRAFVHAGKARGYRALKQYDLSEKESLKAIAIAKELNSDYYYYGFSTDMGEMFVDAGKYNEAEPLLLKCLKYAKEGSLMNSQIAANLKLYEVYNAKKNYEKALFYHVEYSKLNDSINDAETNKIARELEKKYEDQKKLAQIEKLNSEKTVSEAENERKGQLLIFAIIGCALILIALGFAVYAFINKRKANIELQTLHKEVSLQKNELFDKNKNITDSILYAQRIQKALLTSHVYIKESISEFFIINKPKDIVSGDFYWAQRSGKDLYFMLADCTGHGVPGAFMSLLGISYLNELIVGRNLKDTNSIIDQLRQEIISALSDKDNDAYQMKDGMDAVFCKFNFSKLTLDYTAANNAIVVVRNGIAIDLKGDKMPVGRSPRDHVHFTKHEFTLQKNDMVYMFTDGYPDQFGGPKGKKLKEKPLKELLCEFSRLTIAEQEKSLTAYFSEWKGSLEQIDDVCLVGIKI
ncbi:MAG: SpoIIE family protein phosphatase [Sphingobacteriaceae bacterium]|nr:SpoIIE family protein phosphatase [Sphingobacteriaceae bacterium]